MKKEQNRQEVSRRTFVQSASALAGVAMASQLTSQTSYVQANQAAEEASDPIRPFLTPAEEFYTVARGNPKPHSLTGEALAAARMTRDTWRLEITADATVESPHVKQPASLEQARTLADENAIDLQQLEALGEKYGVAYIKAMQCLNIPQPLGQGLWEGVPLSRVLRLAGRMNNVRRIYYRGFHNNDPKQIFQSSVSYAQAMETAPGELPVFLAYRLNGEPIPPIRGGPVRMIVPWAHGFKSIKWLQEIFVTNDYRINDTYALNNNDPESFLKTAAYLDPVPKRIKSGESVLFTGQVISGLSGFQQVQSWVRPIEGAAKPIAHDAPELVNAPWRPCELLPAPQWDAVLPQGVSPKQLLGFDPETGQPKRWPLRYGTATWQCEYKDLKPGKYQVRARAIDGNGFAQPEPRPLQKSGKNDIPVARFEIV